MTILNWKLEPARAVVITDSLITEGCRPSGFGPKTFVLPHLRALLACKGLVAPVQALWASLMTVTAALDLEAIVELAPGALQLTFKTVRPQVDDDECYIYLFGWSDREARILGFVFAWENGFAARRLADGELLIPPPRQASPGSADWGRTIYQQQAEDRLLALDDRDNIGGHVLAHLLVAHPVLGAQILIERFAPLPHYAEDLAALPRARWPRAEGPDLAVWERCEPWLAASLATDNGSRSLDDVRRGYKAGAFTLFPGQRSAGLVEDLPGGPVPTLHLYLLGGELKEIRDDLLPRIETFAYRSGYAQLIITGRKGWARAFGAAGFHLVQAINAGRNWWLVAKPMRAAHTPMELAA